MFGWRKPPEHVRRRSLTKGGHMRAAHLTMAVVMVLAMPTLGLCDEPATLGTPVSSTTLDEQRGGDDTEVHNNINIDGDVTDNTATNVVTGANNIQNGSFDNAS